MKYLAFDPKWAATCALKDPENNPILSSVHVTKGRDLFATNRHVAVRDIAPDHIAPGTYTPDFSGTVEGGYPNVMQVMPDPKAEGRTIYVVTDPLMLWAVVDAAVAGRRTSKDVNAFLVEFPGRVFIQPHLLALVLAGFTHKRLTPELRFSVPGPGAVNPALLLDSPNYPHRWAVIMPTKQLHRHQTTFDLASLGLLDAVPAEVAE